MSPCWEFYALESPSSIKAKCKLCNKDVSRGGRKVGKFNTSNLIKHLENHHKKEHAVYRENSKKKKEPPPPELLQQNVEELFKGREKNDKNTFISTVGYLKRVLVTPAFYPLLHWY